MDSVRPHNVMDGFVEFPQRSVVGGMSTRRAGSKETFAGTNALSAAVVSTCGESDAAIPTCSAEIFNAGCNCRTPVSDKLELLFQRSTGLATKTA